MKLSIITINYNNFQGLQKTLNSVACQSWHDFEHIIVDGASSDLSPTLIQDYASAYHPYSVKWLSEPDAGIYNAMNKGIKMARGEYLLFLNSGDYLLNEMVLSVFFQNSFSEDVVYGYFLYDYNERVEIGESPKEVSLFTFIKGTIHHTGNSFIKKEAFERYGLYDESLKIVSDWKWFLLNVGLGGASTRYVDVLLSVFDSQGISEKQADLARCEREMVLSENIPSRYLKAFNDAISQIHQAQKASGLVRNTRRYKLGNALLSPFHKIRSLLK